MKDLTCPRARAQLLDGNYDFTQKWMELYALGFKKNLNEVLSSFMNKTEISLRDKLLAKLYVSIHSILYIDPFLNGLNGTLQLRHDIAKSISEAGFNIDTSVFHTNILNYITARAPFLSRALSGFKKKMEDGFIARAM